MINKELEKKLKKNFEFSEKLCEALNKYVKNEAITYTAIATNEDIGVRQVLDRRGLKYNTIYFKDEIISKCRLIEIVDLIWLSLGRGDFCATIPTREEINLYDRLKDNDWLDQDIWINEGCLYINDEEFYIEDIQEMKIDKDIIELQFKDENDEYCKTTIKRGLEVKTESINKMIPFAIMFNDLEGQLIKNINGNEIDITAPAGQIYSQNGELHYKDKLGDGVICKLDDITEICYLVNKNEYRVEFDVEDNQIQFGYFNKYGFEM